MAKKLMCFTCSKRTTRDLTLEERKAWKKRTGKLFPPKIEVKCNVTGEVIELNNPACEEHEPDELMTKMQTEIGKSARKLRKEVQEDPNFVPNMMKGFKDFAINKIKELKELEE